MTTRLYRLEPLVVDGHRRLEIAFALSPLLTLQETSLIGRRQFPVHQPFIIIGLVEITLLHICETCIITQLTIYTIIGLIVHAKGILINRVWQPDGVEDIEGFVVHTDVRTTDGQLRPATYRCGLVAQLFRQHDALTDEPNGRIAHKRPVEFVESVTFFIFLTTSSPFEGMACRCYLRLSLSHISGRFGDGLIYLFVARFDVGSLCPKGSRQEQQEGR